MSKTTDKRAYARTQPKATAGAATWQSARDAYEAADRAFNSAWDAAKDPDKLPAQPLYRAYVEARDALLGTPAPDAEALAFKLAVLSVLVVGENIDTPERRAFVSKHGGDEAKAVLACYLDAMALAGTSAPVTPHLPWNRESARVWWLVARHASIHESRGYAPTAEGEAQASADWARTEDELIRTHAAQPINIAYKLRASWIGREPAYPHLDSDSAPAIINDPEMWAADKLVASAFLDLLTLAEAQQEGEG